MRIKYDSICFFCRRPVKAKQGYLHRAKGQWWAHCLECHKIGEVTRKENKERMRRLGNEGLLNSNAKE